MELKTLYIMQEALELKMLYDIDTEETKRLLEILKDRIRKVENNI